MRIGAQGNEGCSRQIGSAREGNSVRAVARDSTVVSLRSTPCATAPLLSWNRVGKVQREWLHVTLDHYTNLKGQISIGSTASPPRSARWNEEMDARSARRNRETGCQLGPIEVFPLVSVGCARIPILARSINAPHQRSDTLMQLSRSPAQSSALRRTAGPHILAQSPVGASRRGRSASKADISR